MRHHRTPGRGGFRAGTPWVEPNVRRIPSPPCTGPFLAMDEFGGRSIGAVAVGLLVASHDGAASVDAALQQLENQIASRPDTEAARIASMTISRGWFHAKDDGNLARRALAMAVGQAPRMELHLASTSLVTGLPFEQMVRPLAMNAVSIASDHVVPCEILVAGGPMADSGASAEVLMETACIEFERMEANPPVARNDVERLLFSAAGLRPFRRNYTVRHVTACHPLVQVADLALWANRPTTKSSTHLEIGKLLKTRSLGGIQRDGIVVSHLSIGGA